jgi:glycosyltransferase involved in cell wall biosynthesis
LLKILLATYWVMPHVGGVKVYLDQITARLRDLGHQVDILAHHPDFNHFHIINTGQIFAKQHVTPYITAKVKAYFAKTFPELDDWCIDMEIGRYSFELAAAYFGLKGYDIIHTQDVYATIAMRRVKPRKVPLVATIHGGIAREMMLSGMTGIDDSVRWKYCSALEYMGATGSDCTIVPSHWLKQLLATDYGVPKSHMHVINNGMDVGHFIQRMEQPAPFERRLDRKVMICPARLVTIKGQQVLLEALAIVKQERSDWECWLVGDGPNRQEFVQLSLQHGLQDHVHFFGDRDDVPQLLKLADLFIMVSLQDNFPYAVMEAQLAGKPAIVSDAGGIPEMVEHGVNGLISSVGDAGALSANIRRLLEDEALRTSMAEAARSGAQTKWTSERMTQQTLQRYEHALQRKRGVAL